MSLLARDRTPGSPVPEHGNALDPVPGSDDVLYGELSPGFRRASEDVLGAMSTLSPELKNIICVLERNGAGTAEEIHAETRPMIIGPRYLRGEASVEDWLRQGQELGLVQSVDARAGKASEEVLWALTDRGEEAAARRW